MISNVKSDFLLKKIVHKSKAKRWHLNKNAQNFNEKDVYHFIVFSQFFARCIEKLPQDR